MKVLGNLMVIVKAFDIIDFIITIEVMELTYLVSARHVNDSIDDPYTEWLKKPCCDSLPVVLPELTVNTIYDKDITQPCGNGGTLAVGKEVKTSQTHPRIPGIFQRECDFIHFKSFLIATVLTGCGHCFRPPLWPSRT